MVEKSAVLAIFALTYLGIAAGRVAGLKLDRTGIVLLGAIAMLVFGVGLGAMHSNSVKSHRQFRGRDAAA